ncbi:MAG: sorbosone dehydrogenase family protein [Gammaproteobacteria bacterium]|jgi:glucose/arabinose dehydrogenase
MQRGLRLAATLLVACLVLAGAGAYHFRGYLVPFLPAPAGGGLPGQLQVPAGFRIHLYAADVPGARSLALSPAGTLFVGTRDAGKVYAVQDTDGDYRGDRVRVLASGLDMPNGVAFHDGDLYVAEVSRVLRFARIEQTLAKPPQPEVITADYPDDAHHGWKFIAFGPDGWLYVPVGAPCNVCLPDAEIYASITRLDPRTGVRESFARGVRNSVGFDWNPATGSLWFTDNGRDWMGDDHPPDELNRAPRAGLHFGFPFCHGRAIADPEYGSERDCAELTPPLLELGPHVAALGMRFYTGTQFPEHYRGGIFIAEHGSWNRKTPLGYRVMFVAVRDNQPQSYTVFAEGWLRDGEVTGRPVDVLVMPDGSLLVSDDKGGRIYRIVYTG